MEVPGERKFHNVEIPKDVWWNIASYLNLLDYFNLAGVCKTTYQKLLSNDSLIRKRCEEIWKGFVDEWEKDTTMIHNEDDSIFRIYHDLDKVKERTEFTWFDFGRAFIRGPSMGAQGPIIAINEQCVVVRLNGHNIDIRPINPKDGDILRSSSPYIKSTGTYTGYKWTGTMEYNNGLVYRGEFLYCVPHGVGTIEYPTGYQIVSCEEEVSQISVPMTWAYGDPEEPYRMHCTAIDSAILHDKCVNKYGGEFMPQNRRYKEHPYQHDQQPSVCLVCFIHCTKDYPFETWEMSPTTRCACLCNKTI